MELADYLAKRLSEHIRGAQKGVTFGNGVYDYSDKSPAEFSICENVRLKFAEEAGLVKLTLEGCENAAILEHLERIPEVKLKDNGLWQSIDYPILDKKGTLEYIRSNRNNCIFLEAKLKSQNELSGNDYQEAVFEALYHSILAPILIAVMKSSRRGII